MVWNKDIQPHAAQPFRCSTGHLETASLSGLSPFTLLATTHAESNESVLPSHVPSLALHKDTRPTLQLEVAASDQLTNAGSFLAIVQCQNILTSNMELIGIPLVPIIFLALSRSALIP